MDGNVSIIKKLLTKRNIFIALGVVILAEVLWAYLALSKSSSPPQIVTPPAQTSQEKPTIISLEADKTSLKTGDKVTVSVKISSNKLTSGTDVIINYDPKLLSVETIGADKTPLVAGNIYSDYPQNSLDEAEGKITVTGITQTQGGVLANGLFGTLVFQAKTAGSANISLDYTPGSTTDSNVTESETVQDVLERVENLELNILP